MMDQLRGVHFLQEWYGSVIRKYMGLGSNAGLFGKLLTQVLVDAATGRLGFLVPVSDFC